MARTGTHSTRFPARACGVGLAVMALSLGGANSARAQVAVGPQVNAATETDFGVGGRVLAGLGGSDFELVGSFDLYFPDGPTEFWEINANVFHHFHLGDAPSVLPYLGGGLNIGHLSNGSGEAEAGLNLGGGIRIPSRSVTPFFELRGVVSGFDQVVFTAGLLFGDTGA